MNMSVVKGFLGELVVGSLLRGRGYDVHHLGGQHGSDLVVRQLGAEIDVKTSSLKKELGCPHWGWALHSGSKKKALTFTHLVCVALDASLELAGLFVIGRADLERFPAGVPPFVNNRRILFVTQDGNSTAGVNERQKTAVSTCAELLRAGAVQRAQRRGLAVGASTFTLEHGMRWRRGLGPAGGPQRGVHRCRRGTRRGSLRRVGELVRARGSGWPLGACRTTTRSRSTPDRGGRRASPTRAGASDTLGGCAYPIPCPTAPPPGRP